MTCVCTLQEGVDYDAGGSSGADDSIFPSQLVEGTVDTNNHILETNSHQDEGQCLYVISNV